MFLLLLLLPFLHITQSACPKGFDLVRDGQCRGYYGTVTMNEREAAVETVAKCAELNAFPVIIHNEEQQKYWNSLKIKAPSKALVLGLVCNTTSNLFEWADGSAVDYYPVCHNGEIDGHDPCQPWCVWYMRNNENSWDMACWTVDNNADIYCTAPVHQPAEAGNHCGNFEHDKDNDVCYQIDTTPVTWKEAQQTCKKAGANLASIHNDKANSFVRRLAVSKGAVHGVFLGATFSGKGDSYGWTDGTVWNYSNFSPGYPMPGFGDCIDMDTSSSSGQWMNIDCAAKLPVACVRENKVVEDKNVTCGILYFEEDEIITSPGFPHNASIPCDYLLTVTSGKKVEVEVAFLEANSCCDFLIIYDGNPGPVLANLTGEIRGATYTTSSSNIMRVSWQPNGGVNVMGMAMSFRGV